MNSVVSFKEHRVSRPQGMVYARDYPGAGPAFVLMHGFPDNLRIYDQLIPHLTASGRRIVTFDFLGFGQSDKPPGAAYSFEQQLGDLEAVVDALGLGRIVPVAHDSSGIVTLNFLLAHPSDVESVVMLNSAFAELDTVLWPEVVELFAIPSLRALALAMAASPEQFGWLLTWQQQQFVKAMPEALKPRMATITGPLIADNFMVPPGSGPAFAQTASRFMEAQVLNSARVADLKALDVPVKLVWGEYDPYLTVALAEHRLTQLKRGSLTVVPAGHWLQIDTPELVAAAILS